MRRGTIVSRMRHNLPLPSAMAAACLLLASCGQADQAPANETVGTTAQSDVPAPQPGGNDQKDQAPPPSGGDAPSPPGASLPPPDAGLRFVGLWAAEPGLCEDKAWRFTATSLRTPASSVCQFSRVTPVGGGYDIEATCTAEAPPADDVLKIRFAESAKAMMFESESIADAGLIYCGPAE